MMEHKGKRAIVLCGGGSLGSYEMGVWKLLNELHIDYDIVTGTSIGALNGAMMTLQDFDLALKMWDTISADQVMADGVDFNKSFFKSSFSLKKGSRFRKFLRQFFSHNGANITPFKKIIKELIDPAKVQASPVDLGIVTCTYPGIKELDIIVKDLPTEDVIPFLHASSACFPIFPIEKIHGKKYVDGGFKNNLPINLAVEMGATEIVAVLLDSIPVAQFSDLEFLPNVTRIAPTWPTGSMMNFAQESIQKNLILGYNDAMKVYKLKMGFRYTFNITSDFNGIAREFFNNLIRHNTREFKQIDVALRWRIQGSMSEFDYFLRALELVGEFDGIDYLPVYDLKDFIIKIHSSVLNYVNDTKVMIGYDDIEKNRFYKKINERSFIYFVLRKLQTGADVEYLWGHVSKKPVLAVIIALLQTLYAARDKIKNK